MNYNDWKWYVKINLNKPANLELKKELENGILEYWLRKSKIVYESSYRTNVSYIKKTNNKIPVNNGTMILELNSRIFTLVMHEILIRIQDLIQNFNKNEVIGYMRGIIAGEGCVESNKRLMKYRVHISASKENERVLYQKCLQVLDIELKVYDNYSETVISKKINNFKLLELDLMSLNPTKYAKFLEMLSLYDKKPKGL